MAAKTKKQHAELVEEFVKLSRTLGARLDITQGTGGNAAVKSADGRTMVVKASGRAMGDMTAGDGYRVLDLKKLKAIARRDYKGDDPVKLQLAVNGRIVKTALDGLGDDLAPSLETLLHAQLGRCSIHVHPPTLIGLISSKTGKPVVMELLEDEQPLWLNYANPGYALACELRGALAAWKTKNDGEPHLILMANHGACFVADDVDLLFKRVRRVLERVEGLLGRRGSGAHRAYGSHRARVESITEVLKAVYSPILGKGVIVERVLDRAFHRVMGSAPHREAILAGALTPEQVAYAGGEPVFLAGGRVYDLEKEVSSALAERRTPPRAVAIGGTGLFVVGRDKADLAGARDMTLASAESIIVAGKFGGAKFLSPARRQYVVRLKNAALGE